MGRNLVLFAAAAVFCSMFSAIGQELPEGEFVPGENQTGNEMGLKLSADQRFPYVEKLRTNINRNDYHVSLQRTEKIASMLKKIFLPDQKGREKYVKAQGEEPVQVYDEKQLLSAFEKVVSKQVLNGASASPVGKPNAADRLAARAAVQGMVKKKFPAKDSDMEKKFLAEAQKKYPIYKKGDKITVYYSIGSSTYRASGTFYGYGIGGRSIIINSRAIAMRDLSPADRARFDRKSNRSFCQRYVESEMKKYRMERFNYELEETNKFLKKEIGENDKKGFIYYGVFEPARLSRALKEKYDKGTLAPEERLLGCVNKWVSASTVIQDMAKDMIAVTKKRIEFELAAEKKAREEAEARKKLEEQKAREQNNENAPQGENQTPGGEQNMDLPE